ncbi:molybdopterin-guanine dinucleotide biosynthesis protein B [Methanospirillum sp.]|uniref:molybdopterin-guanine dinucleotide biosynthesis protein B n=1 Tax=Methanospirillum sp. TaxID=45200 RepID=UPI00298431C9|nr:molybdopterin-guanine dinucleotide biosynthesis protein B [Methanospirillum sp.]
MKIIHIAGWSGSGKTRFIVELCSHLVQRGRTATIKHIDSHHSALPPGKDTTLHFEAGADPAIGIDDEKTTVCFHTTSLDDKLNLLSDSGVRFAVIEGFKRRPFKKVLIGDLDYEYLLKDPEVTDVLEIIDQFDDWYTQAGLIKELEKICENNHIYSWTGYTIDHHQAVSLCDNIEKKYMNDPRVAGIRARVHKWVNNGHYPVFLVMALSPFDDGTVFSEVLGEIYSCSLP